MTKNDFENFIKEKGFIVLFSLFYIFALFGVFLNFENIFLFISLTLVSFLVLFFNFGYKRSLILVFIFLIGILRAGQSQNFDKFFEDIYCKNVFIKGQIISSKQIKEKTGKIKFYLKVKEAKLFNKNYNNLDSKILVVLNSDKNIINKINFGDYIYLEGTLKAPLDSTNPYQFNYKKYLENENCVNVFYAKNESFKIISHPKLFSNPNDSWYYILQKFEQGRNKIILKHSQNIKSPNLEILAGLVFGNETITPDEKTQNDFKTAGLLHLLCASGLNVALIFGIWNWIAILLKLPFKLSILTGAGFVILYTFMTGFPPSILRASVMLLFVLFGKLIDRSANAVSLIFTVGFLILYFNPKMLLDIGFELSFIVTLGLIICCPVIAEKFKKKEEKFEEKYKNLKGFKRYFIFLFSPLNIVSIFAVPLIAQMWVIPLQLHYFNNIAPLSIFANIAVVPFIGVLSFVGFISSLLALFPKISSFAVFCFDLIANPLLTVLVKISEFFASFKFSLIETVGFNCFQIFLFWGIILILTLNIKFNFDKKYLKYLVISVFILLLSFIKIDDFKNNLEITAFDVQNADCLLIKTPKKKYIMIDCAKSINNFHSYLRNKRINTIDYLIITHFDIDHCAGFLELAQKFKIKNIILQSQNDNSAVALQIMQYLKDNKMNYKSAKNKETIYKEDNLEIKTYFSNIKSDNESSIVSFLKYKDKKILFNADVGISGFNSVKDYIESDIDIFKIGHHGAKDTINSEMIKKLNPKYSIISAGGTRFNHPDFETINLLEKTKHKFYITRYLGFLKFVLKEDNKDFEIYHYNCEKGKIEKITDSKKAEIPFDKGQYFRSFVKENSK